MFSFVGVKCNYLHGAESLLEKLIDSQKSKRFSSFMEPESSLTCSQEPTDNL